MRKRIICIALSLVLLLSAVGLMSYKSDWLFVLSEAVSSMNSYESYSEINKSDLKLKEYTLEELKSNGKVEFEYSGMLINTSHKIPADFSPNLAEYASDVQMDFTLVEPFKKLAGDVESLFGEKLYISSAYRTREHQLEVIAKEGDIAAQLDASEHQAGLALDVYVSGYAGKAFIKSDAGRFVNSRCHEYGFIIRYPYYGEKITGISYEPWHLRYVGAPHAGIIYKNRLTMEEYFDSLKLNSFYGNGDYIFSRQQGDVFYLPEEFSSATVSHDNTGGYLITLL